MHDVIEQLPEELAIVVVLQFVIALFLDRAQLKRRQKNLLGKTEFDPIIWPGRATISCFWLLYFGWFSIRTVYDFSGRRTNQVLPTESSKLFWKIVLAAICIAFPLIFAAWARFASRMRALHEYRIRRGQFFNAVNKLSKRSRLFRFPDIPVYVLPDQDFGMLCARMGGGVLTPLRLLNQLTRKEIDVLAARQLYIQSGEFYVPALLILLVCNIALVSLGQSLQISPLYAFLLYLSLLTVELFALSRSFPRMFLRTDLRAIRLTGNAEAFFSALGGLSRFTGVPPQEPMLLKIGRKTGVSPERIKELLAEHETKPEDRYPTTGSYMDTGL
jgi:hypothetical protein